MIQALGDNDNVSGGQWRSTGSVSWSGHALTFELTWKVEIVERTHMRKEKTDQRGIRPYFFSWVERRKNFAKFDNFRQVGGSIQSLESVQSCVQRDVIFPDARR